MSAAPVLTQLEPGYRILTLNRPEKLNAFNEAMHAALRAAIDDAEADEDCRALLITGAGRAFCAGQDLSDRITKPGEKPAPRDSLDRLYNPLVRRLRALPFPVVAAVNGVAAGAGANIALACDIVMAGKSASFIQSFARLGLVPDSGGTWILPRLVGQARARGLALIAQELKAEKAAEWGMIWRCVNDDALLYESRRVCEHFSSAPTQGLALIKRALDASATNDFDTQLDLERDLQKQAHALPDYAEGVRAFMEKRKPKFLGRKQRQTEEPPR
jgi:2-(1,2-epoxy-1,2-dihydrophenyl)acetyl-CoA isomerase